MTFCGFILGCSFMPLFIHLYAFFPTPGSQCHPSYDPFILSLQPSLSHRPMVFFTKEPFYYACSALYLIIIIPHLTEPSRRPHYSLTSPQFPSTLSELSCRHSFIFSCVKSIPRPASTACLPERAVPVFSRVLSFSTLFS